MEAKIRKIGNSRGLIIPHLLIEKYKLEKVRFKETEQGILLVAIQEKSGFRTKLDELRRTKSQWQATMRKDANDPDIIAHYRSESQELGDIDIMPVE